jgi:phage terminase large subunit
LELQTKANKYRCNDIEKYASILDAFYSEEGARRTQNLQKARESIKNKKTILQHIAIRENIIDWMVDWCWTFDPRNPQIGLPATIPWIPWPRQIEFIEWFYKQYLNEKDGLVEKSRDAGATWLFCLVFLREWRWEEGFAAGIGSRKLTLVDDKENPKAVFPKIRHLMNYQPGWWFPKGFNAKCDKIANMVNPEKKSTISGEGGDDIGRGDRRSVYLIDEAAFLEHPMMADSSLSQTTNSQFDLSTPNGMNHFGQKRHSGRVEVFTFHWKQDARKTQEWYENETETLDSVVVAQEIDIDYHASVEGIFIPPTHVQAAIDLDLPDTGVRSGGCDVAAGGDNKSSIAIRTGCKIRVETFNYDNGVDLVNKAIDIGNAEKILYLNYDKIGVGHSFYSVIDRTDRKITFQPFPVNAGGRPSNTFYDEFGRPGHEIFQNARAEWWYITAMKFKKTFEYVTKGEQHPLDELISIDNNGELISQLSSPKKYITETGKIKVESKDSMLKRGIKSPDEADGLIMALIPQNASNRFVWPRFKMSMARNFDISWKWAINVGALYLSKDMKLSFICAVWDRSVKKLFVYGELIATQLSLSQIAVQIFRGMQMERRKTFAVYGNDIMFHDDTKSTTELLNTELHTHHKQKRLRRTVVVVEPYEYDRLGAINLINLMFHEKQIVVHKSCKESARQFSSWYIEKDKPVPIGFELCEALAHIVSELNRTEKIKEPVRQMTDYPPVPMKKEEEIDNWWWQTQ